ncbi:MAG: hypothetical protein IEMM0008_0204 [bacterium]|nr:MAG: hypothetical protein IEMM0008_0204 [bacterium]
MIEVEKKGWIRDHKAMLKVLNEKARFIKECRKEDIYYTLSSFSETAQLVNKESKIFRIRHSEGKYTVTYKIKSIRDGVEVNIEEEFYVDDCSAFEGFAKYLGYQKLIEKTKVVKLFDYQGITLEYVHLLGLGYFLEGEILCEYDQEVDQAITEINNAFQELGVASEDIEERMYIELLLKELEEIKS